MTPSHDGEDYESLPLDQMITIFVDENGIWHRPDYPRYKQVLAAPKPFLVPSFDDEVVEVLPSEKQNRKIRFEENVHVMEIENRFQLMEPDEMEDDDSYEIEIVEGSGAGAAGSDDDADFYLEMIDGEIFYVFETEDDISVEDEYDSDDSGNSSDGSSSDSDSQTSGDGRPVAPMQLNIGDMMAPNLDESFTELDTTGVMEISGPSRVHADTDDNDRSDEMAYEQGSDEQTDMTFVADKRECTKTEEFDEDIQPESKNVSEDNDSFHLEVPSQIPLEINTSSPVPSATIATAPLVSPPRGINGRATTMGIDTPPFSPVRTMSGLTSPGTPGTPRSILKAYAVSPTKSRKKDKKVKKDKKEKTFTKTFVRATDFDGEHRVYSWEKPTWTNQQLRSTGKGDDIRKGGNLAQPITDAAQLIDQGKVKWEKPEWALQNSEHDDTESDIGAKEELIRKIQDGSMNLPGSRNNKRRLKLSINGSLLAAGGDIVQPITKATIIKKPSNINYIANPKILRATPGGSKLWSGESLAGPVTQATTIKKYDWEKPSWIKPKLHATGVGEKLKSGQDVAEPIATKPNVEWEKPDWAIKRGIGRTNSATQSKKEYTWEKPSWAKPRLAATEEGENEEEGGSLKATEKGQMARKGGNLGMPITQLPQLSSSSTSRSEDFGSTPEKQRSMRRSKSDDF